MTIIGLVLMTVKAERLDDWVPVLRHVYQSTIEEDEGCIAYEFYRQANNPHQYVLFEQWRDEEALDAHMVRLQNVYGPPAPGGQLPAALLAYFEQIHGTRYEPAI